MKPEQSNLNNQSLAGDENAPSSDRPLERVVRLRAYMVYDRSVGAEEGACLVFAHTAKGARQLGYEKTSDLYMDHGWIDCAVTWLKGDRYQHLFKTQGDPDKIANGIPHVNESPTVCKHCELWGCELKDDGICLDCHELIDFENEDVAVAHAT